MACLPSGSRQGVAGFASAKKFAAYLPIQRLDTPSFRRACGLRADAGPIHFTPTPASRRLVRRMVLSRVAAHRNK